MSLDRNSDVKNHLSTGSMQSHSSTVRLTAAVRPEAGAPDEQADAGENPNSPIHLIGEEPVANAQVGGSVGVPAAEPWRPRKL